MKVNQKKRVKDQVQMKTLKTHAGVQFEKKRMSIYLEMQLNILVYLFQEKYVSFIIIIIIKFWFW